MGLPCLLLLLPLLCGGLMKKDPRYWLEVQEVLEVQEGLCAHVPCSVYHHELQLNTNFNVYWFREGANGKDKLLTTNNEQRAVSRDTQGRFSLLRGPQIPNCSLSISDARMSDTGTYFFRVEQGQVKHSYKEKQQQLRIQVKDLTQKPAIHVSEPLLSGRVGHLICSLPGACNKTNLIFSWPGEMINPNTEASSELSLMPGPQDHGRNLCCRVKVLSTGKSTEGTIQLNVFYAPQNLTANVSFRAASGRRDQSVNLLCRANSNPPAELSWHPGSPGKVTITQNTATLVLHLAEVPENAEFTCQARNYLGSQAISVRLSGVWKPDLLSAAVPGALGLAGALALLSLCLCLIAIICMVRVRRKLVAAGPEAVSSEDPVMDSVPGGLKEKHCQNTPQDQAASASEDTKELHYASLSFQGRKLRESQHPAALESTEYSEIRTCK